MVTTANSVEWTVVNTEVEALQLEFSWIKEYDPRFNVKYRDDKTYPYLAVTLSEKFPRVQVLRGDKRSGVRYFGPYAHAWAIRETVDLLLRVFPVRTCSQGVFRRAEQAGRPCLLAYIDKCSAPCVGRISISDHRSLADQFCDFMAGNTGPFIRRLEREMQEASQELEFERAARLRDDVGALRKALEKSAVVFDEDTDADIFAVAEDDLEAAVQVFHIRGGRIRGQRGWVVEKVEDIDTPELLEHLLLQVYGGAAQSVPREVLVPVLPAGVSELVPWLEQLRVDAEFRATKVELRVPVRGDKKSLLQTVHKNAEQALALHKSRRSGDLTVRSQALQEIQAALDLAEAPLRIECFDVSHLQGTQRVASMVVFEDGLAKKSEYRRFIVQGTDGNDDTAAMREILRRRLRHLDGESQTEPESGGPAPKFAYPPQLLVVDGGLPQVNAAATILTELGITDIPVIGLAKRLEEIWLPGAEFPVVLPRSSSGLYLLQQLRDEAHRFAISHHRKRRSAALTKSVLDDVPGLGATRRAALLAKFGSVKRLRAASVADLVLVPGIGQQTAEAIVHLLGSGAANGASPVVNTRTGEVIDD